MRKLLLSVLFLSAVTSYAQNQFSFGFTGDTDAMLAAGWERTNQSTSPSLTALWSIADYEEVPAVSPATPAPPFQNSVIPAGAVGPVPNGQDGTPNTFALVNYASTTSTSATAATISNWLITPAITVENGDIVTFYSRKGTSGNTDYPDRLELRMSSAATHVIPTGGPTGVGSFTTVGVTVNPTLAAGFVYPKTWTQYSYTVAGLTGATSVRFAFRYFVAQGGVNGNNSDLIGIDTFSVDRTLSTADFFAGNFAVHPNPVKDVFNITAKNGAGIEAVQIMDINGRTVSQTSVSSAETTQINVSNLNAGVYFVKVQSVLGIGTTKIVKQ